MQGWAGGDRGWGLQARRTDSPSRSHSVPHLLLPMGVGERPIQGHTTVTAVRGWEWTRAPQVRAARELEEYKPLVYPPPFLQNPGVGEGSREPPPTSPGTPRGRGDSIPGRGGPWAEARRKGEAAVSRSRAEGNVAELQGAGVAQRRPGGWVTIREAGCRQGAGGSLGGNARTAGHLRWVKGSLRLQAREWQNYNFWKSDQPLQLNLNSTIF